MFCLLFQIKMSKIIYTYTDEAPMLATYSLLPVFQRFAKPMGVTLEKRDISVAGRYILISDNDESMNQNIDF